MTAALYVETHGVYFGLDDVDPWDKDRDARRYAGPYPVVAHPPCASWCQLASVNYARWGSVIGDDGGTFAAALRAVRAFGGVLEHPAYSIARERYGLPRPIRGGWTQAFDDPGITTEISQCAYGHKARKRTWLYAVGVSLTELNWTEPGWTHAVGSGIHAGQSLDVERIDGPAASRTPIAFRDALLDLARSARIGATA